jgi:HEAT repeat protein
MLSDGYEEMREETSKAIEKIGDTLPALTEGLKKGDVEARRQAAFWLRQFRDAQAAPALIDALADADAQVRQGAAERLGELGQLKDRSSVVPLIAALSDVNSDVKTQAAQSLGLLGDPMAVDALVRELKRSDDSSWRYFAEALIKIGDISIAPQVIARIRKMAKSERHWPNLRNALTGFGIRAAPFMLAALDDRDAEVRHLAASVLAQVGDAEAIPPMERAERKYHQQEFCPFCKALQDLKTR